MTLIVRGAKKKLGKCLSTPILVINMSWTTFNNKRLTKFNGTKEKTMNEKKMNVSRNHCHFKSGFSDFKFDVLIPFFINSGRRITKTNK